MVASCAVAMARTMERPMPCRLLWMHCGSRGWMGGNRRSMWPRWMIVQGLVTMSRDVACSVEMETWTSPPPTSCVMALSTRLVTRASTSRGSPLSGAGIGPLTDVTQIRRLRHGRVGPRTPFGNRPVPCVGRQPALRGRAVPDRGGAAVRSGRRRRDLLRRPRHRRLRAQPGWSVEIPELALSDPGKPAFQGAALGLRWRERQSPVIGCWGRHPERVRLAR